MTRSCLLLAAAFLTLSAPLSAQTAPVASAAPAASNTPAATIESYASDNPLARQVPAATAATGAEVVSAADPRASAAGIELLRAGGNAVDAALATMLALNVVEPQSSGIGGGGFLLFYDATTGETVSLDGRERAPAAAGPNRFVTADGRPMPFREAVAGGYSVGVPGALALAAEAHKRWGKRPWAELFQPAIRYARDGIEVSPRLNRAIAGALWMLERSPAARRVFLDADGKPWPVGHRLRQPEMAATLEQLAKEGPDAFYRGAVGAEITSTVANAYAHPAELTAMDLAAYRAETRPSLCRPYRSYLVCSMGPPSAGGTTILEILKQLERFDLRSLGPDNLLSQHLFAESQRLAYADRDAYGADADFENVPVEGLLDDAYLAERSALIHIDHAIETVSAGVPKGVKPRQARQLADIPATTHFAAADRAGNVASFTNTIEGGFGSGLMAGGFMLNNELTDFDFLPVGADGSDAYNGVQAGKRPRSSMSPTIVFDQAGKPVMAVGAAGGSTIIAQVAKALIAYIDWGMSIEDALAAPQLLADRNGVRLEAGTRLADMAAGLQALGHKRVEVRPLPIKLNGLARVADGWRGAADPRSEGRAVANGDSGK